MPSAALIAWVSVAITSATDGRTVELSMFNVPPKPMLIRCPARDTLGKPCSLIFGLYRVNFAPISFEGPSYKEGLKTNYNGQAVLSKWDEKGVEITDLDEVGQPIKKVGKLITVVKN